MDTKREIPKSIDLDNNDKIPQIEELFQELTKVDDLVRREEVVVALLRLNTKEVVSGFLNLLLSPEPTLRSAALEALQIMAKEHLEQIALCLFAAERDLRILVLNVLMESRSLWAAGPVRRLLQTEETDENVLATALEALGELGDATDLTLLEQIAKRVQEGGGHPFMDFVIQKTREKLILKKN